MRILHLLAIFALSFLPFQSFNPLAQPTPSGPQLHLQRGTFDARAGAPTSSLSELGQPVQGPYAILQFSGPIQPSDRIGLEITGVEVLEYLPDFAYLVRGMPDQLNAASMLKNIYARVPFTKADKLAPSLLRLIDHGKLDWMQAWYVSTAGLGDRQLWNVT
jgi:hypothetical protein